MHEPVELRPAFAWDCPECGREQFARTIVAELSSEEIVQLKEQFGADPWESGYFLTRPNTVTCADCGHVFTTCDFALDAD